MLKPSRNGTQATTAVKFSLRPTAKTLADLSRAINPWHLKTWKQGNTTTPTGRRLRRQLIRSAEGQAGSGRPFLLLALGASGTHCETPSSRFWKSASTGMPSTTEHPGATDAL